MFGVIVIGIMVFVGIGLLLDLIGEFLFLFFVVIVIFLLLSWVLVVIVVLMVGYYLFES